MLKKLLISSPKHSHSYADLGLLLLRIYAGLTICRAGLDKVPLPDWFLHQVNSLGLPASNAFAYLAAGSELLGGLLVAVGLFTRPAALFAAASLGVAAFDYHQLRPLVDLHVAQLYFWVFVAFAIYGGGPLSFDAWVHRGESLPRRLGVAAAGAAVVLAAVLGLRAMPSPTHSAPEVVNLVSVAGNFNNWDASQTNMSARGENAWEGVIDLPTDGILEFKFVGNGSWDTSWGVTNTLARPVPLEGTAVFSAVQAPAGNIQCILPGSGPYRFAFDVDNLAYSVEPAEAP